MKTIEEETEKKYCSGMYYNFKKGMELCNNSGKCKLFENYIDNHEKTGHYYGIEIIRLFPISEFRNCKLYLK